MWRESVPKSGEDEAPIRHLRGNCHRQPLRDHSVGANRQVRAVLLNRTRGKEDERFPREGQRKIPARLLGEVQVRPIEATKPEVMKRRKTTASPIGATTETTIPTAISV